MTRAMCQIVMKKLTLNLNKIEWFHISEEVQRVSLCSPQEMETPLMLERVTLNWELLVAMELCQEFRAHLLSKLNKLSKVLMPLHIHVNQGKFLKSLTERFVTKIPRSSRLTFPLTMKWGRS